MLSSSNAMPETTWDSQWMTVERFQEIVRCAPPTPNIQDLEEITTRWEQEHATRHLGIATRPMSHASAQRQRAMYWSIACETRQDWQAAVWMELAKQELEHGPLIPDAAWERVLQAMTPAERLTVRGVFFPAEAVQTVLSAPRISPPPRGKKAQQEWGVQSDARQSVGYWTGSLKRIASQDGPVVIARRLKSIHAAGTSSAVIRSLILDYYTHITKDAASDQRDIDSWAELAEHMAETPAEQAACVRQSVTRSKRYETILAVSLGRLGFTPSVCEELMRLMPEWIEDRPLNLLYLVSNPAWGTSTTTDETARKEQARRQAFFRTVVEQIGAMGDLTPAAFNEAWGSIMWPQEFMPTSIVSTLHQTLAVTGVRCAGSTDSYGDVTHWWSDMRQLPPLRRATVVWQWLGRLQQGGHRMMAGATPTSGDIFYAVAPGIEGKGSRRSWIEVIGLCEDIGLAITWAELKPLWERMIQSDGPMMAEWLQEGRLNLGDADTAFWRPLLLHSDKRVREIGVTRMRPSATVEPVTGGDQRGSRVRAPAERVKRARTR